MTPLLLHNTRMYDPLHGESEAGAMLIEHGRISRIFKRKPRRRNGMRTLDLYGSCIMPGFIDSHTHLIALGTERYGIDLTPCVSIDDCLEALRKHCRDRSTVIGYNWDESTWPRSDRDRLDRTLLDRVSKHRPVIMRRVCGHCAVVNTAALQRIPGAWKIVDRRTGWLYEDAALYIHRIFKPDPAMVYQAVELGITAALRRGITTIHEIGDLDRFFLLQRIQRDKGLRLRIAFYVMAYDMDRIIRARLVSGFGNGFLKFAGIKVFMDGSIGARTAALSRPYRGWRTRGKLLMNRTRLARIVDSAERNDLQLMIHTIGDRSTALVLSALRRHADRSNRLRHRLEHVEALDARMIDGMARLNLIASVQPNFVRRWQQPGGMYEQRLGGRYRRLNCFRTMHRAGVRLTFGSDCMPLGPLFGIQGACQHPFPCGRISLSRAFHLYTGAGAFATGEEHIKGRLQEGMLADLVVLNKDPRAINTLDRLEIITTIVGGRVMFHKRS